jgi:hypothetical protein
MSTLTRMAIVIILLALAALGVNYMNTAHAAPVSLHGYYARGGYAGPVYGYQPQQTFTPQFNNPGPQLSMPQPGNAVDQLSPLMGAGQPDALGIK